MSAMESLDLALKVAADDDQPDDLRDAAIDSILPKTFMSGLTILPTPGGRAQGSTARAQAGLDSRLPD